MLVERYISPHFDITLRIAYHVCSLQSTIACALEQHLLHLKKVSYRLDGDNVRFGLNKDLGFDEKSRNENIRRIGEVRFSSILSASWRLPCSTRSIIDTRWLNCLRIHVAYAALPLSRHTRQIVNLQESCTKKQGCFS